MGRLSESPLEGASCVQMELVINDAPLAAGSLLGGRFGLINSSHANEADSGNQRCFREGHDWTSRERSKSLFQQGQCVSEVSLTSASLVSGMNVSVSEVLHFWLIRRTLEEEVTEL